LNVIAGHLVLKKRTAITGLLLLLLMLMLMVQLEKKFHDVLQATTKKKEKKTD